MKFDKQVGNTIGMGRITVPQKFKPILDQQKCCPLGSSIDITYILPNGSRIPGRLYQSQNPTTYYYQFYIVESHDKNAFWEQVKNYSELNFEFILETQLLYVKPSRTFYLK